MLKVARIIQWSLMLIALTLLAINTYGFSQSLRPATFSPEDLRFGASDISLSLLEYQQAIKKQPSENDIEYAKRLTDVIAQGTAHIHWEKFDPKVFNQRVPIWENWILYFMGVFSGIPEFERYHFVSPEKSVERGIGICGEVSMLMTSLLERNGIPAEMVTVPGHVLVTATIDGETKIFDPDFGVVLPYSAVELQQNAEQASQLYVDAGYKSYDKAFFLKAFSKPYKIWSGPEQFITKKFYFEKVSYWLMWLFPISLMAIAWRIRSRIV
jgi:hypothetical protein